MRFYPLNLFRSDSITKPIDGKQTGLTQKSQASITHLA